MKKFLIFLLLVLIAGGLYYYYKNKINSSNGEELIQKGNSDIYTNWGALSQEELIKFGTEAGIYSSDVDTMSFFKGIDLTGDDVPEGIISSDGVDASTYVILIKNIDGNILIAKRKDKEGIIMPATFSSFLGYGYRLLPQENGFYVETVSDPFDDDIRCLDINLYKWNNETKLFEWNQYLTSKYKTEVCK